MAAATGQERLYDRWKLTTAMFEEKRSKGGYHTEKSRIVVIRINNTLDGTKRNKIKRVKLKKQYYILGLYEKYGGTFGIRMINDFTCRVHEFSMKNIRNFKIGFVL